MLIENKELSLIRAKDRSDELGLNNVWFIQANLDYFSGAFNIGVSDYNFSLQNFSVWWIVLETTKICGRRKFCMSLQTGGFDIRIGTIVILMCIKLVLYFLPVSS